MVLPKRKIVVNFQHQLDNRLCIGLNSQLMLQLIPKKKKGERVGAGGGEEIFAYGSCPWPHTEQFRKSSSLF